MSGGDSHKTWERSCHGREVVDMSTSSVLTCPLSRWVRPWEAVEGGGRDCPQGED